MFSCKKEERRIAKYYRKNKQYLKSGKLLSDSSCKRSTLKSFDNPQQPGSNWNKCKSYEKQQSLRFYIRTTPIIWPITAMYIKLKVRKEIQALKMITR